MCDCMREIENAIANKKGGYCIDIEGVRPVNIKPDFIPLIRITYRVRGEIRLQHASIIATFCPVCGKKYEE